MTELRSIEAEETEALVAQVVSLKAGRGVPAIEVTRPDGASLSLGTDGERAALVLVTGAGASSHSVGGHGRTDVLVYDYMGSWTEVPDEWTVPLAAGMQCLRRFLESGATGDDVPFEDD